MKLAIASLIAILSLNAYVTHGDCETDNGKKIDNCQSK